VQCDFSPPLTSIPTSIESFKNPSFRAFTSPARVH
jgi:hypothetical protein